MKTITSILGESLAATLVIIVCLSLPSLFGLPIWTLPFFGVPAMLYLDWRLGERRWPRWKIARWVVGMSLFLFLWTRFVPSDYWWLLFVVLIIFPPSSWLFWRKAKRQDSHHAA